MALEKRTSPSYMDSERATSSQRNLNETKYQGLTFPEMKTYFEVTGIKTVTQYV